MESKQFDELCQRAATRNITLFSRFLNLAQQKEAEIAARKASAAYRFSAALRIASGKCWAFRAMKRRMNAFSH